MAAHAEEILDDAVDGCEALQMARRLEAPPLAFTLTGWLMRDFGAVIRIPIRAVDHRRHDRPASGRITAELVGDEPTRHAALAFQQLPEEPPRRAPIPPRLDQ